MKKSHRYDYSRHPYFEKPLKDERKYLHRKYRRHTKNVLRMEEDYRPMKQHSCYAN